MQPQLKELMVDEVQCCLTELETLLDHHIQWLGRLHESLFCGAPIRDPDVAEDAHHHCDFGRWYHGSAHPLLANFEEFEAIGAAHASMHRTARALLLKVEQGEPVGRDEYSALTHHLSELRRQIIGLESRLRHDLGAVSKLTMRVFENAGEGVLITDPRGVILQVNRAFSEITGYVREEVIGRTPGLLKSGRHDRDFYQRMWAQLTENGHWQGEVWNRRKDGRVYPEWLSISVVRDDSGEVAHYVGMFSDITAAKRHQERLDRLAYYDPLTELPNRALFQERLRQALSRAKREGQPAAVVFLDLDRFKGINDTLGHSAGDNLLIEVARRLVACVRESDTAARLSGDEFVVVLPQVDGIEGATKVAQKLNAAMAEPFHLLGQEYFVTTSIGVALYPAHATDVEGLTKAADVAMYEAKSQGRNTYRVYRPDIHAEAHLLFQMEHGLRHALERGELEVFYQPQVEVATGRVMGMEALLRWFHPEKGLISPSRFIPIAEENGMIGEIGEWVLRTACRQRQRWCEQGLAPVYITVNVSNRQLERRDFAEQVAAVLDDCGLEPEWLKLELTETTLMHSREAVSGLLRQLKSLGVHICIDDFGVGYSGLGYLRNLPVDVIKIDRSFIEGVTESPRDEAITRAIIALAQALGVDVVAEGVENIRQLEFLRRYPGADAQGFYFSEPVDEAAAWRLLDRSY